MIAVRLRSFARLLGVHRKCAGFSSCGGASAHRPLTVAAGAVCYHLLVYATVLYAQHNTYLYVKYDTWRTVTP